MFNHFEALLGGINREANVNPLLPRGYQFIGQCIKDDEISRVFHPVVFRVKSGSNSGVKLVGPDLAALAPEESPLGIEIELNGGSQVSSYCGIFEKMPPLFLREISGVEISPAGSFFQLKISQDAKTAGFSLPELGKILQSGLLSVLGGMIKQVGVTVYSLEHDCLALSKVCLEERKQRAAMEFWFTDREADPFFACHICSSYSPRQVCILRPEKPALCGVYNWRDAQLIFRLDPSGPFRPVTKGRLWDELGGEWQGVNEYLNLHTGGKITRVKAYSLLQAPETACSCAQVIAALVPEVQGFLLVSREYRGLTPLGLTVAEILEYLLRETSTPGFAGLSRAYLRNPRFLKAEGGTNRLVWISQDLKREWDETGRLPGVSEKFWLQLPGEHQAQTLPELIAYLNKVGHPVLTMENLI